MPTHPTMKRIIPSCLLGLLLAASGCSTTRHSAPRGEVVAGGVYIYWKAPSQGTACLVENKSHTIIRTDSMGEGDYFEFDAVDDTTRDLLKVALPAELKSPEFILHFLPSQKSE